MDIRANNPTEKLRDGPTNCESKVQLESTLGSWKEVIRCKKPSIAKTNFFGVFSSFWCQNPSNKFQDKNSYMNYFRLLGPKLVTIW